MRNVVLQSSITEVLTLNEVREHLGITMPDDNSRDTVLQQKITSVRELIEQECNRFFSPRTVTTYFDTCDQVMRLAPDLISVSTVKYLDVNGVEQTMAGSNYYIDTTRSLLVVDIIPSIKLRLNAVYVTYTAGLTTCPQIVKDAMYMILLQSERFQTNMVEGGRYPMSIPNAALQLLTGYRNFVGFFN